MPDKMVNLNGMSSGDPKQERLRQHQVREPQNRHFWRLELREQRPRVMKQPDGSIQGSKNSELEPDERQLSQD